jgi:polysaccharide biosynthesis protein PslG
MRRATHAIRRITLPINRNPVARTVAALLLFLLTLGALALTAYTDQLVNGGVTWAPQPPGWEPPNHTDANPMGVNLFLEKEVEPENITRTLRMVREAGFTWARQGFAWNDIEISAKGNYTDTRNPGPPVDAWAKYDRIVDAYNRHGVEIIARLDSPPVWARKPGADVEKFRKGPPRDLQDYADFAEAVATRYGGRIQYFQIWNEPNLHGEWGGEPINAAEYVAMLKAAHGAIKRANPDAVIITAALAPTAEDSVANQNDILFLEAMYRAGAAPYFDILSTMLYGLGQSPYERRTDLKRLNFSRPILLRGVMERNGDAEKPIWISEYAWLSMPADFPGDPNRNIWGENVDEATQARWLVEGYERARREWPWMGVMSVWYFREPDFRPDEPAHYFTIVRPDYTPRPAYNALKEYAERLLSENTGAVERTGYQEDILDMDVGESNGRFGTFTETIRFSGTGLQVALCRFCSLRIVEVDGRPVRTRMVMAHPETGRAGDPIRLLSNLGQGEHTALVSGNWGTLVGESAQIVFRSVQRRDLPEKPLLNAWGYPLLYGLFGLLTLASGALGLASAGRWAGAALNTPKGRYPDDVREWARNGAAVVGMGLFILAYHRLGSIPLALAALGGFTVLAYLKPQAALAWVAAVIPLFWLPREIGHLRRRDRTQARLIRPGGVAQASRQVCRSEPGGGSGRHASGARVTQRTAGSRSRAEQQPVGALHRLEPPRSARPARRGPSPPRHALAPLPRRPDVRERQLPRL